MMVALAALEAGVVGPDYSVFCRGKVRVGNHTFHCWKRGGHGRVDMIDAHQKSCDVYFYDIARKTGIDRIAEMATRFGLGQETGIDLPNERPGLIPTRDWKLARWGAPWQQGDTVNAGIGQGYITTTPLQLAVMAARIANGGYAVRPRLVHGVEEEAEVPSMGISNAALKIVRKGMERVVNHRRGTAYRSRIEDPEMAMAGKTGSAQVRRISKAERRTRVRKNEEKPWEERDHALFVAYAPLAAPRYAVAVVVEHGGGGSKAAAPVARDILLETQKRDPARRPPLSTLAVKPGGTTES
jgi:penicillin-binding protein 2